MKVSGYDSNYIQQTTCGPLMKKFLKENIIKVRFITNYISNVLHSFKFNFATVSPH